MRLVDFLGAAIRGRGGSRTASPRLATEAQRLAVGDQFLTRGVNVEFSGGEQKRAETLQLAVLEPKDGGTRRDRPGLDVDARSGTSPGGSRR